jgi:hypothetical protein
MDLKIISRKEYNLLELTLLMGVTVLCALTLNFYYYEKINNKLNKLKLASSVLFENQSEISQEGI